MKKIAIITARGGSKRIPRKNIRSFVGKPIIQYSIDAALESKIFYEVMVSTDDLEIAEISLRSGAKIPFMRSQKTSTDFATTTEVLTEVIDQYRQLGQEFDYACCLYPTAPFINSAKLKVAFSKLIQSGMDSVIPVSKYSVPIWWALKKEHEIISLLWPENGSKRSQDVPEAFYDVGQFYFFLVKTLIEKGTFFTEKTIGLEVPETEVQDIDNEDDWNLAEIKYSWLKANKKI
jgi:N-acylneuraminate cytidylyltransferase